MKLAWSETIEFLGISFFYSKTFIQGFKNKYKLNSHEKDHKIGTTPVETKKVMNVFLKLSQTVLLIELPCHFVIM